MPLKSVPNSEHLRSAKEAGLRYVTDTRPGIRREKGPLGFKYIGTSGRVIRDKATITRLNKLAVPPAWTDVWICPDARGHLQATGRDAKGRKQYRYHHEWRASRDETKYDRLIAFAQELPKIRQRTQSDLARSGLPCEKVLATVVQLLDKSLIRVGNDEYAKENRSYGLTTMRNSHVAVRGSKVKFIFKGKSGVKHTVDVDDKRLARVVKACQDLPGQELFEYFDRKGRRRDVGSGDVNEYLRQITGEDFTAKDFRTWAGTVLACTALQEFDKFESQAQAKKNVVQAIEAVAGVLGNTRTVCRKSYIHPAVLEAYMDGAMVTSRGKRKSSAQRRKGGGLRPEESAVLALLQQLLSRETRKKKAA
jgi:DNA topoisomerase-1